MASKCTSRKKKKIPTNSGTFCRLYIWRIINYSGKGEVDALWSKTCSCFGVVEDHEKDESVFILATNMLGHMLFGMDFNVEILQLWLYYYKNTINCQSGFKLAISMW